MKLQSIETIAIDIPLKQNFGGATYSVLKRSTVITRLRAADGLVSNVYNGDNRAHAGEIVPGCLRVDDHPRRTRHSRFSLLKLSWARFSNVVYSPKKRSLRVPMGPLRCLPMMISAMPFSVLSSSYTSSR